MARRIDSQGVMNEWAIANLRRIETLGVMTEWYIPLLRQIDSMAIMVEYSSEIYGSTTGTSTVTGNLSSIVPVYKMSLGDFTAVGTLNGNVYLQGLSSTEVLVNGTLFGKLKLSGTIEDNILTISYLWDLNKLKTLSIGILNIDNVLDGFLHLNGYNHLNADIPQDNLLGFGHLHGLTEGETYFTVRVNGIILANNYTFGQVYTKGLTLTFNQNVVTSSIQNTLFTFNGKQLVYPI